MLKRLFLFFSFLYKRLNLTYHKYLHKILGNDKYIKKYSYYKSLIIIDLINDIDVHYSYSKHATFIDISIHNYSLANAYKLYVMYYLPNLYRKNSDMSYYYNLRDDILFKLHHDYLHLLKNEVHINTNYMSKTRMKYSVRLDQYLSEKQIIKIIKKLHKEMVSELKKEELNLM